MILTIGSFSWLSYLRSMCTIQNEVRAACRGHFSGAAFDQRTGPVRFMQLAWFNRVERHVRASSSAPVKEQSST